MNEVDPNLGKDDARGGVIRHHLRYARVKEVDALDTICRQSKRHWGYDDDFMRKAASELVVPKNLVELNQILVADTETGIAGVGGIERTHVDTFDVSHLFVHPQSMGLGIGASLFSGLAALAKGLGATKLTILSDPNAVGFYERMGAVLVGEQQSSSATGRMLPLLSYSLKD